MDTEYLNNEHLVGFDNYKYSCQDTSPLSKYVMHPFWNKLVLICPKWVAPNLLTFSGFLFTTGALVLFSIFDYHYEANTPDHKDVPMTSNWVFVMGALFLFLGYTLDGIDGKQARRTGTSGPLGELFDHGLDSFTASMITMTFFSMFGQSATYSVSALRMYFILWNVLLNFYLTHFEKYNTGVLYLPWGYDFSMWCIISAMLTAGIFGIDTWQLKLPFGITAGVFFEMLLYISSLISNVPTVGYNIYLSYRDRTGYMRSFSEAVRPLVSVFICFVLLTYWIFKAPVILEKDSRAMYFCMGCIFSNTCCRLIVAQMSNTRCELFNWLLLPTAVAVIVATLVNNELVTFAILYSLLLVTFLAHMHYGTCVVRQMCKHFHIQCFKIRTHLSGDHAE